MAFEADRNLAKRAFHDYLMDLSVKSLRTSQPLGLPVILMRTIETLLTDVDTKHMIYFDREVVMPAPPVFGLRIDQKGGPNDLLQVGQVTWRLETGGYIAQVFDAHNPLDFDEWSDWEDWDMTKLDALDLIERWRKLGWSVSTHDFGAPFFPDHQDEV